MPYLWLVPLLLVLVLLGLLLWLGTALLMALAMLRPPRMTDGKAAYLLRRLSPGDLGLTFEEMSFTVRDERTGGKLKLAAWWIPHPQAEGRCVVLIHGYSDAKVGAIAWAPTLHALGWSILAIDLRAHGESEGTFSTAGYFEREDVNQVINQWIARRPQDARQIVLFGVSMGSAVAAATAAMREDLAGVVLESPFTDHYRAALVHAHLHGLPGRMFLRPAQWFVRLLSGADFDQVRPVELIPRIPCALMIIHCAQDAFVPEEDAAALQAAAQSRSTTDAGMATTVYWRVEGAAHVMGLCADPEEYRRRLDEFLRRAQQFTPQRSSSPRPTAAG